MPIKRQNMYDIYSNEYVYDLKKYNTTYFEIPKNGSSSIRRYFADYCCNDDISKQKFIDGGGPSGFTVNEYSLYNLRTYKLVIIRNPVARIKSAYSGIYLSHDNHGKKYNFENFMLFEYPRLINSTVELNEKYNLLEDHLYQNHFKPQSWFIPIDILNDENTIVINLSALDLIKNTMTMISNEQFLNNLPKLNTTMYDESIFDNVSDNEIEEIINYHNPDELYIYKSLLELSNKHLMKFIK